MAVPAIVCLLLGMIGLRGEAARAKCGLILETKQDVQKLRSEEKKGENMNLRELLAKIVGSSREDWHLIADPPSGLNRLQFHEMYESQQNVLHTAAHPRVAVYIPEVSITVAWGPKWLEDFTDDWCKKISDQKANAGFVDMFFNNSLVYRTPYVQVDGIYFPPPRLTGGGALEVDKDACVFMRLVDSIGRSARTSDDTYESDLRRAGFAVVDKEWPKFVH